MSSDTVDTIKMWLGGLVPFFAGIISIATDALPLIGLVSAVGGVVAMYYGVRYNIARARAAEIDLMLKERQLV